MRLPPHAWEDSWLSGFQSSFETIRRLRINLPDRNRFPLLWKLAHQPASCGNAAQQARAPAVDRIPVSRSCSILSCCIAGMSDIQSNTIERNRKACSTELCRRNSPHWRHVRDLTPLRRRLARGPKVGTWGSARPTARQIGLNPCQALCKVAAGLRRAKRASKAASLSGKACARQPESSILHKRNWGPVSPRSKAFWAPSESMAWISRCPHSTQACDKTRVQKPSAMSWDLVSVQLFSAQTGNLVSHMACCKSIADLLRYPSQTLGVLAPPRVSDFLQTPTCFSYPTVCRAPCDAVTRTRLQPCPGHKSQWPSPLGLDNAWQTQAVSGCFRHIKKVLPRTRFASAQNQLKCRLGAPCFLCARQAKIRASKAFRLFTRESFGRLTSNTAPTNGTSAATARGKNGK